MSEPTGLYAVIDDVVGQLKTSRRGKLRSQLQREVEEACLPHLDGVPEDLLDFVFMGFGRAIDDSLHRRDDDGLRLFESWRGSRRGDWYWGFYDTFGITRAEANLDAYQERLQGAQDLYEEHRMFVDALRRRGKGTIADVRAEVVRKIGRRRDDVSLSA